MFNPWRQIVKTHLSQFISTPLVGDLGAIATFAANFHAWQSQQPAYLDHYLLKLDFKVFYRFNFWGYRCIKYLLDDLQEISLVLLLGIPPMGFWGMPILSLTVEN